MGPRLRKHHPGRWSTHPGPGRAVKPASHTPRSGAGCGSRSRCSWQHLKSTGQSEGWAPGARSPPGRSIQPPQVLQQPSCPAGPNPPLCEGVLRGAQDEGMRGPLKTDRGSGPPGLAQLPASANPHHPGPSRRGSGARRTAVPQPAAPRQHRWSPDSAPSILSQPFLPLTQECICVAQ